MVPGKGEKDRTTILPDKIKESLKLHLHRIKKMHDQDLAKGYGGTTLPDALEKKYPNAFKEWAWQWVFPSKCLMVHPVSGIILRHHVQPSSLQRMIKEALRKSGISKPASCHTLHTTAVHLLRAGVDINTIRAWLGHVSLNTTNVYAEVDLEMKAKALAHCEIPVSEQHSKLWHDYPGVMSFLRAL